ncbi:MAG: excinuclease ABC subunit UvrC [Acidobacteria bacterium]|nr:excinuclease ABC subunit UvrC [Acidobacteriota bacterium]
MSVPDHLKQALRDLPTKPGVYLFRDRKKKLLYVGKARNLKNRVRSYFSHHDRGPRIQRMIQLVSDLSVVVTATEAEALLLENSLIKNNKPQYNVMLRDDKTYPYILVTDETYPRVLFTRRKKSRAGRVFGPFPSARNARQAIRVLHHHFKIRNCDLELGEKRYRPCLQYHIKRCDAPCDFLVDRDTYQQGVQRAQLFLEGKTDDLIQELKASMDAASRATAFEKAAYLRDLLGTVHAVQRSQVVTELPYDRLDAVGMVVNQWEGCIVILSIRNGSLVRSTQHQVEWDSVPEDDFVDWISHYYMNHEDPPRDLVVRQPARFELLMETMAAQGTPLSVVEPQRGAKLKLLAMAEENAATAYQLKGQNEPLQALEQLANHLDLVDLPEHIECFDISHIQGKHTVASMVHFSQGLPDKSQYRRYNIKQVAGIDDYASMAEVVHRRYKRLLDEGQPLPQLIVVDGGLGQLHAAHKVLSQLGLGDHPLISLAKREELVYRVGTNQPLVLPYRDTALRLLQQLRDEAHRFGVTFHRKKRGKAMTQSDLAHIEGIGPFRQQKLLRHFGSVEAIRAASLDQLGKVIGHKTAARVFDYFRETP